MARPSPHRLSVEDAKENLRKRSELAMDAGPAGEGSAIETSQRQRWRTLGAALAEAKRRPWHAAGIVLAVGVAIGTSRSARRTLLSGLRRAIARGG